jgi:divalent metal cation (Fe/Co/Zn/Cd) transporter
VVSAYIFLDASKSLLSGHHAERSFVGIILMTITAIGMGFLGLAKRKVGSQLNSVTVLADGKFTLVDAALSGTVLLGLAFNTLLGWWWADQAMALFLSGVAFREGIREVL